MNDNDQRKLERRRKAGNGSWRTNAEPAWSGTAEDHARLCQKIANHMPQFTTGKLIDERLKAGDKVKTKFSTYYLVDEHANQKAAVVHRRPARKAALAA